MSPKPALLVALALASPAVGWASTPAAFTRPPRVASAPQPAKPKPPAKATPKERAEAQRMPPLARAAFWAREVDIDPSDVEAEIYLAQALRALGKYPEAAAAAQAALVLQPTNLEALLEAARAKIDENQGFYAIDDARKAASLAPRDWRPVSLLAIALAQSDRDEEALQAHLKALALAPDNPATLTNLGLYYATHGQPQLAEPLLRKAAAAPGATAQERQNLALVLGLEGRLDEAERLERQDLPPAEVENNLAYLRADAEPAPERTWKSLETTR